MAEPIKFPEANFTWRGWAEDENQVAVGDLPCYRDSEVTVSCWRLSWRERLYTFFRGRVWVHVYSQQPPMSVQGEYPFVAQAEEVYINSKCPVNCHGCNAERCWGYGHRGLPGRPAVLTTPFSSDGNLAGLSQPGRCGELVLTASFVGCRRNRRRF